MLTLVGIVYLNTNLVRLKPVLRNGYMPTSMVYNIIVDALTKFILQWTF